MKAVHWFLWQPAQSHQPLTTDKTMPFITCIRRGRYVYVCEQERRTQGGKEGEKIREHLYSTYWVYSNMQYIPKWFLCMSVCFCVYAPVFPSSREAKRSRGWRQVADLGSGCVNCCMKCLFCPLVMQPMSVENAGECVWGHANMLSKQNTLHHQLSPAL